MDNLSIIIKNININILFRFVTKAGRVFCLARNIIFSRQTGRYQNRACDREFEVHIYIATTRYSRESRYSRRTCRFYCISGFQVL